MTTIRDLPEDVLEQIILPNLTDEEALELVPILCPRCYYKLKKSYTMSEWLAMPENFIPTDIDYNLPTLDQLSEIPRNLTVLTLSNFDSSTLDGLPEDLIELNLFQCKFETIHYPPRLEKLTISDPGMMFNLPEEIFYLELVNVAFFPPLPDEIKILELRNCPTPTKWPTKVESIRVENQMIEWPIPPYPNSLKHLNYIECQIRVELPELPPNLQRIGFFRSTIFQFPDLPEMVRTVWMPEVIENFANFPIRWPPQLKSISGPNQWKDLIDTLPPSVKHIHFPMMGRTIDLKEKFPDLEFFYVDDFLATW